ncbi:hypothetical protein GCM10027416_09700 [Okibacterium endophyticum]
MREILAGNLDVLVGVTDLCAGKLGEDGAVAVDELGQLGHRDPSVLHRLEDAHPPGDLDGIASDVDRRAVGPKVVSAFYHGDVVALGAEGYSGGEAGHAGSGDEDAHRCPFIEEGSGSSGDGFNKKLLVL